MTDKSASSKDFMHASLWCYEHIRILNKDKQTIEVDYCPNVIFTFQNQSKILPNSLNQKSAFGVENVFLGHFPWMMREASEMM